MFSSAIISVSLSPFSIPLTLFRARSSLSLFLSSYFFVERLSRRELADASHTGLTFTGVYACGLKLHVAEACTITSSQAERRNKFTCWKCLLSHILLLSFSRCPPHRPFSLFLSLSALHPIISVAVLNLFIAQLTLLWCILLTARAEAEREILCLRFSKHTIYR